MQPNDVSIIIPAHQAGWMLHSCLEAVAGLIPPPGEVIIVVDGANKDIRKCVEGFGFDFIGLDSSPGVSAARNTGAKRAKGSILAFLDSDVQPKSDFILSIITVMTNHPEANAAFGSYDAHPASRGIVSRYRNLLHHYTHQSSPGMAQTFWAGCGVCHAEAFQEIGGFDEQYRKPSIEDIELGYRLRAARYDIILDPSWQVCHLKKWRLNDLIVTDLMRRAYPWSLLLLQNRNIENNLNVDHRSRASAILCILALAGLVSAFYFPTSLIFSTIALLVVILLNRRFYLFLMDNIGWGGTIAAIPLHLLYFVVAITGFMMACATFLIKPPVRKY